MKVFFSALNIFCILGSIFLVALVKSDLPIHVEIKDVVGKWTIEETEGSNVISHCGSSQPNNNVDNLKIDDYRQYLLSQNYKLVNKLNVILSDEFVTYGSLYDTKEHAHRKDWKVLAVYDEKKNVIGCWTTIYDEGIEIRLGNKTYTAFMHYTSKKNCKISNDDGLDSNGETECYSTNPNKIRFGWFDVEAIDNGEFSYGCFYAEKVEGTNDSVPDINNMANIDLNRQGDEVLDVDDLKDILNFSGDASVEDENGAQRVTKKGNHNKKLFSQRNRNDIDENNELQWHKSKHHGKKKKIKNKTSSKNLKQKYACPCSEKEEVANMIHKEKSINVVSHSLIQMSDSDSTNSLLFDSDKMHVNNRLDLDTYDDELKNVGELDINELPSYFTWGDPFNNNAREYDVLNQLKCGSCYIASLMYVLKRRIEISLTKRFNKEFLRNFDDNLSIQSILSCSFYDQGCHGGYPFLVSKYGKLQGIPLDKCLPYTASQEKCPLEINNSFIQQHVMEKVHLNENVSAAHSRKTIRNSLKQDSRYEHTKDSGYRNSVCDKENRWFIKNYSYVGGCYGCNQCNGEKIMMNEIYRNGPIVTSFEATSSIYNYESGIYYEEDYEHAKRCSMRDDRLKDFVVTGWERVNHAIVIVGWGEEVIHGTKHKYWIARNSWGSNWGNNGYFKIIRGVNFNAIESQNIFVDPDFSRGAGAKIVKELEKEFIKNM